MRGCSQPPRVPWSTAIDSVQWPLGGVIAVNFNCVMKSIAITGGSGFIGTNLIEALSARSDIKLMNLDVTPPKVDSHREFWVECDLRKQDLLVTALRRFQPAQLIHLAGRTDMLGRTIDDYAANHVGTENLIRAIGQVSSVERVIFTSSQFVVGPGELPRHDCDFRPHTIYGASKAKSEEAVRRADPSYIWTIIRPTNIWGKWHPRYPNEFWKILKQGRYFHPGGGRVTRSYGYVGTIIQQMAAILNSAPNIVDKQVFYVGDPAIDLFEWTNAFSWELRGAPVRVIPRPLLRGVGLLGDVVVASGGRFPLSTSRYRSMTESYPTPMEKTFERLGRPTITLQQGVQETVAWLRGVDSFWV
jgi:GlcNAc-P-P-Und epimerase